MKSLVLFVALIGVSFSQAEARHYKDAEWKAMFIRRPYPHYPYEMRRRNITGSGWFRMDVDEAGKVVRTSVLSSTGNADLDSETLRALAQWRARPGARREVDIPVTFTMTGFAPHRKSYEKVMNELNKASSR